MSHLQELKNVYFPSNLQNTILAKRRASTTIDDYYVRKQRQIDYQPKIDSSLKCLNCDKPFIQYVMTICKHAFCQQCLQDNLLRQHRKCPYCKTIFKSDNQIHSLNVDYWVERIMKENEDYQERLSKLEQWKNEIKIDQFEVAMRLDVFDTDFIWCEAEIKRIILKDGQAHILKIHYIGWTEIYDELIHVNSPRLAKLGSFTQKKNVLKYSDVKKGELQRRLVSGTQANTNAIHQSFLAILDSLLVRGGIRNNNNSSNENNTN